MSTKTAKTKPKPKTTPDPLTCNYMVKKVDRQLWARFVQRAKDDGHSLAWLFRNWIEKYADGQ